MNDADPVKISMSISSALRLGQELLAGIGIDTAHLDSQILCCHALEKSRLDLLLSPATLLSPEEIKKFYDLLTRRLCFEPIAYIVGCKEFYGHDFFVTKDCLIPRPDTECVLEAALKLIPKDSSQMLLDLCTGSGAIGLSALMERENLQLVASDISESALAMASRNAVNLGLLERVQFVKSNLFEDLPSGTKFDFIISNPPYISPLEFYTLARDVRDFEPHIALFSSDSLGLGFYQKIIQAAPRYLKPGGYLILEMGFSQRPAIQSLVDDNWAIVEIFTDLAGIERGIVLRKLKQAG